MPDGDLERRSRVSNGARAWGSDSTNGDTLNSYETVGHEELLEWDQSVTADEQSEFPNAVDEDTTPWWRRESNEEFVISGIAGRYPESNSIAELEANLYSATDMITSDDRRWPIGWKGLPTRNGKINGLTKFDASFFSISPKQVNSMDPQMRILLEVVYEAIVDAGVDPESLRGTKTGVFLGISGVEGEHALMADPDNIPGYVLTGCQRSMMANRISYTFDFQGPSFPVDTACSSSLLALQLAIDALRQGDCDSAIVCGSHLNTHPLVSLSFLSMNMLTVDGKCKSFDSKGDGYVRSEAISAVLLQKASVAKRVYATVVHTKSSTDGYKEAGVTVPSGLRQLDLLDQVYKEAGVDPNTVSYVEAHGTGTKVGDPQEAHAITEVFCKDRTTPLLIGAVKSNLGHSEPSSALSSIAKVILSMERGIIPPNLHFEEPNPYIPGLTDGRLKIVSEPTPWEGGYAGINSFGFGGANTHALLKWHPFTVDIDEQSVKNGLPRLQCVAGRTEEGVKALLESTIKHSKNNFYHGFMSELSNLNPLQAVYRGYALINRADDQEALLNVKRIPVDRLLIDADTNKAHRPVYFIYSGMGSQWPGMAKQLMRLDGFRQSIRRCSEALRSLGIDPFSLLMNDDDNNLVLNNTMNCMVCITAVQIALTDLLKSLGVVPSGIIGHSTGEVACGYADGCMTRGQAMRIAYHRGHSIIKGGLSGTGAMAAVGLSWEDTVARLPKGVYPACHNAQDSVTISGDTEKVNEFVKTLKSEDIFAKVVDSAGVPFHSPAMMTVKDAMLQSFQRILPVPVKRSDRWISSSIPGSEKDEALAAFCSAEYQVNNAVSKVLFYDALQKIPENAVTIEIGPSSLLASILKRSTPQSCDHIGLLKRNDSNELESLLSSFGRIHQCGIAIRAQNLYGRVQFPVPRGTPQISPLVKWDHEVDWFLADYGGSAKANLLGANSGGGCSQKFTVEPNKEKSPDAYLADHVIDGRKLYPFTGYLCLAWQCLAKLNGLEYIQTEVLIEEFTVLRATLLSDNMNFKVFIRPGDGAFNITESDVPVCNGRISIPQESTAFRLIESPPSSIENHQFTVDGKDIYKELLLRGYEYGPEFRCMDRMHGNTGRIKWTDKWVPFLDACIQTWLMADGGFLLRLPTTLRYIRINPALHEKSTYAELDGEIENKYVDFIADLASNNCIIGGVEIGGLKAQSTSLVARSNGTLILEQLNFIPFLSYHSLSGNSAQQEHLTKYLHSLSAVVKSLLNDAMASENPLFSTVAQVYGSQTETESPTTVTDESYDTDHAFIVYLKELLKSDKTLLELTQTTATSYDSLITDPLYGSSMRFGNFKMLIDIVVTNTPGVRFKFAVCEDYSTSILNTFAQVLMSHPKLEADWLLIGDETNEPDAEFNEHHSCTHISHDFTQTKLQLPESFSQQYDALLLHRVLSKQPDVVQYLKNARQLLKAGSFVVVVEPTSHFELNIIVDALYRGQIQPPSEDTCRQYGFYLKHDDWLAVFESSGYDLVSVVTDDVYFTTSYLIRCPSERRQAKFLDVDDVSSFSWLPELQSLLEKEELAENEEEQPLQNYWLTSTKVPDNGLYGMGLSLRDESSKKNQYRMIFNCDLAGKELVIDEQMMNQLTKLNLTMNCYRDGQWGCFCPEVVPQEKSHRLCKNAYINVTTKGDLSSASWIESSDPQITLDMTNDPHLTLVNMYRSPLNFRDIMLATGRLPAEAVPGVGVWSDRDKLLGLEFVGRLPNGRRVMGITSGASLATDVIVDERCCTDIPEDWTFDDAATVPMAYSTTFYSLFVRAKLQHGERVLIHSGTGAVGQAAITICYSYGCEVFTTVGNDDKRKFIKELFPQLDDAHISNSRSTQFELDVLRATNGKGVDVVLNSLAGDKLQASVRCLAEFGRFLEIGKFDLSRNTALGMEIFLKSITFHGVLLDAHHLGRGGNAVDVAIQHYYHTMMKDVKPLSRTVFPSNQVAEAFKYMSTGNHMGKVIIKIRDDDPILSIPSSIVVNAIARTYCNPKLVYIITGGLGGFGLELAKFLIQRDAKNLVLTSRSGIKTGYQKRCMAKWTDIGVNVIIDQSDISKAEGANQLIKNALDIAPIGGLFHLAMVLRDNLIENQTVENFQEVAQMKYWGTRNLDHSTRQLCDTNLRWFVVFSSMTAGRGNAGQSAYGWGNSSMERIVEKRRYDGHCGMAIQWGAIGDVGIVMDNFGSNEAVVGGTSPQRMNSCIQCFDMLLTWNHPVVSSFVRTYTGKKKGGKDDVLKAIADVLGVSDPSTLKLDTKLTDFGIDSLIGVELRQLFERDYNVVLTMKEIRTMTLRQLKEMAENDDPTVVKSDKPSAKETKANTDSQMTDVFKLRLTAEDIRDVVWDDIIAVNDQVQRQPVFLIHAIEGVAAPLRKLAESINSTVLCIQHTERVPMQSIQEMAACYVEILRNQQPTGVYKIVGYSYGATVAFEMASQLEHAGCQTQLVMVDASPKYWQMYTKVYRRVFGVGEKENMDQVFASSMFEAEMLSSLASRFGVDGSAFKKSLYAPKTWEDRLKIACDAIAAVGTFKDAESVRWPIDSFKQRFIMANNYLPPTSKFHGDLTLIKSTDPGPKLSDLGDDYGLREISDGQLNLHVIEGDHDAIVQGDQQVKQVSEIINALMN